MQFLNSNFLLGNEKSCLENVAMRFKGQIILNRGISKVGFKKLLLFGLTHL